MKKILLTLITLAMPATGYAQIVVDDMFAHFKSGKSGIHSVQVKNSSTDQPLLVSTEIYEILNKGEKNEEYVKSKELLLTSNYLQMPPNSNRRIKLLWKGKNSDQDRFFKVRFIPKETKPHSKNDETDAIRPSLKILTGTGILVTVLPQEIKGDVEIKRTLDTVTFNNNSNTHAIFRPRVCALEGCRYTPGPRIYPHKSWTFNIPTGMEFEDIKFEKRFAGNIETITVPYVYE